MNANALDAFDVFTVAVWVFLIGGLLYVIGMCLEYFIEEFLL